MADDDAWDADNFEPELPSKIGSDDKWDGEDEDDRVKDNWEEGDDEDKKGDPESSAYQRPKKKPLAERLAEKEAAKKKEKQEEKEKKEEKRELTAEERLTEKIRIKKIQEQDSLSLAKGLFGMSETSIDRMMPATEEEFTQFAEALKSKITFFEESSHYSAFVVKFISDLSVGLSVDDVKKLGIGLTSLYHEKERLRKEAEKKKKKKSKATIRLDKADDLDILGDAAGGVSYGGYEDDEFI
ncbi:eukaryotic translation initiation factor 3 subunit J-A-like [Littorina saxatilis]|uniref:Eukaryotic translation initiation factor 3 subunit J n=1 Tax=Littorina saxatilis TaxID=31220 RepID=A0AAN9GRU3_9CAEN